MGSVCSFSSDKIESEIPDDKTEEVTMSSYPHASAGAEGDKMGTYSDRHATKSVKSTGHEDRMNAHESLPPIQTQPREMRSPTYLTASTPGQAKTPYETQHSGHVLSQTVKEHTRR